MQQAHIFSVVTMGFGDYYNVVNTAFVRVITELLVVNCCRRKINHSRLAEGISAHCWIGETSGVRNATDEKGVSNGQKRLCDPSLKQP